MKTKQVIEASHRISKSYRVTNAKEFRLKDVDPGDTGELKSEDKPRAKEALQTGVDALTESQDVLYAQDRWSVLLVFQAMDAAGKDYQATEAGLCAACAEWARAQALTGRAIAKELNIPSSNVFKLIKGTSLKR
jgi:hypothetical protein